MSSAPLYQKLETSGDAPQIRLLTLQPAADDISDVHCTLQTSSLGVGCPEYEALSYYWGDPTAGVSVYCNGYNLAITDNLGAALRQLRLADQPRLLWVDALCINQNDSEERSAQVAIMQRVFAEAQQVVVWLGVADDTSELAFKFCERVMRAAGGLFLSSRLRFSRNLLLTGMGEEKLEGFRELLEEVKANLHDGAYEPGGELEVDEANCSELVKEVLVTQRTEGNCYGVEGVTAENVPSEDETKAFSRLLARPFWTRCWVVQEICVARKITVICGASNINWSRLISGFLVGMYLGSGLPGRQHSGLKIGILSIMESRWLLQGRTKYSSILQLLWEFQDFETSDPKDKVFALLGVAIKCDLPTFGIVPAYQVTASECFRNASTAIVTQSRNLDLLITPRASQAGRKKDLASWMVDWSDSREQPDLLLHEADTSPDPQATATGRQRFRASGDCTEYLNVVKNTSTLVTSGFLVDQLEKVSQILIVPGLGDTPSDVSTFSDAISIILSLLRLVTQCGHYIDVMIQWEELAVSRPGFPAQGDAKQVYLSTISGAPIGPNFDAMMTAYERWSGLLIWARKVRLLRYLGLHWLPFLYTFLMFIVIALPIVRSKYEQKNARIFTAALSRSVNRRLARTKKGYLALVQQDARMGDQVALLRSGKVPFILRQQAARWNLVGEAYVHDIMHGEAWDEGLCQQIEID